MSRIRKVTMIPLGFCDARFRRKRAAGALEITAPANGKRAAGHYMLFWG